MRPKNNKPIPARAGDGAGDGGQRFVRPALILEILVTHRHAVLDALPFANKPRPGDRPILDGPSPTRRVAAVEVLGNRLQPLDRLRLQPAIGEFLDAIGEPAFEESAIVGRRLGLEQIAPHRFQRGRRRGLQRRHAGEHRVGHLRSPTES